MLDLAGVGIEHGFLVQSRNVGCWTLFHCLCCKMDTHAVPNSSQQPFLANSSLVVTHILSKYCVSKLHLIMPSFHKQTDPSEIAILQQNERFSQVYKIILPWLGTSGPSSPRNFPGITAIKILTYFIFPSHISLHEFSDKSAQADQAVTTIQQLMSSYLKKEEEKVEERINTFTEQQHAGLQVLETRIRQERNTLLMYALIIFPIKKGYDRD